MTDYHTSDSASSTPSLPSAPSEPMHPASDHNTDSKRFVAHGVCATEPNGHVIYGQMEHTQGSSRTPPRGKPGKQLYIDTSQSAIQAGMSASDSAPSSPAESHISFIQNDQSNLLVVAPQDLSRTAQAWEVSRKAVPSVVTLCNALQTEAGVHAMYRTGIHGSVTSGVVQISFARMKKVNITHLLNVLDNPNMALVDREGSFYVDGRRLELYVHTRPVTFTPPRYYQGGYVFELKAQTEFGDSVRDAEMLITQAFGSGVGMFLHPDALQAVKAACVFLERLALPDGVITSGQVAKIRLKMDKQMCVQVSLTHVAKLTLEDARYLSQRMTRPVDIIFDLKRSVLKVYIPNTANSKQT